MTQALFYPWIDIRDEAWLKTSLLYWDSVRTIVPESIDAPYSTEVGRALRSYVRTWPLDPAAFGTRGLFVMIEPALLRTPSEQTFPLVVASDLGELEPLSRRELEVLWFTAAGLSAAETAETLSRSVRTVENHIASVHNKLGVSRRAELTRFAVEHGVLAFTREEWAKIVEQAA